MKNLLVSCAFLFALICFPVSAEFKLPNYTTTQLNNGLTVYLMEQKEVPLIDIKLITRAGAVEDDSNYGLSYLTNRALSYGSANLDKKTIEDLFAFHGARFTQGSSLETSHVSLSIAKKDLNNLFPVFRDILTQPKFDSTEFQKDKKRFINQLEQAREQPRSVISSLFNKMYYQQHPYGNPVTGDFSSIEKITLSQIERFYQEQYIPSNSALILVGDFNSDEMLPKITQLFNSWSDKKRTHKKLPPVSSPKAANVWLVNKSDAKETTFMIGGKGIQLDHPENVSIQVINTILGARFTSWLNDELRVNSGLTYGARSSFNSNSIGGTFVMSSFTKTDTTFEAIDLALKTYQRIWNKGIDKKTLESAKSYVKGQFPPKFETSGQLARLLSRMWALNINDSYINDFQKQVDSLDTDKANKIAKSIFPKNNLQFILIGKSDDIKEKAKKYGEIKELDIKTFTF